MKSFSIGSLWVAGCSILGMICSYFNIYLAGSLNDNINLLSFYAIILLLIQTVATFSIFGGGSALSQMLPFFEDKESANKYFTSYIVVSVILLILMLITISIYNFYSIFSTGLDGEKLYIIIMLIFVQQLLIYCLPSLKAFKLYAFLSAIIPVAITITLIYLTYFNNDSKVIAEDYIVIICIIALSFSIIVSSFVVFNNLKLSRINLSDMLFCCKNTYILHVITLFSFIYLSLDQFIVLEDLGSEYLAVYFLAIQISQLVRFIPTRLGQVFLSSFSSIIRDKNRELLISIYTQSSIFMIVISTIITFIVIKFNGALPLIFGEYIKNNEIYVIYMCIVMVIGSLGPINSMLVLAYKENKKFLFVNFLVVVSHFSVLYLFINDYALTAIIFGKMTAMIIGQVGNMIIVYSCLGIIPNKVIIIYVASLLVILISYLSLNISWVCFLSDFFMAVFIICSFYQLKKSQGV